MMNTLTKTLHVFRSRIAALTPAILTLMLLNVGASTGAEHGNDNRSPDLGNCQRLQAPAADKVAYHVYAEGVQIFGGTARLGCLWRQRRSYLLMRGTTVQSVFITPVSHGRVSAVAKWPVRSSTAALLSLTRSPGCC